MHIEKLRSTYNNILNGKATREEERHFLNEFLLNSGGMSTEWFYSNLNGKIEEPSKEEIHKFMKLIEELFIKD